MPSASRELNDEMRARFGESDIPGPLNYLKARGYVEKSGCISPPASVSSLDTIPDDDWSCILYLVHEWDFSYEPVTVGVQK